MIFTEVKQLPKKKRWQHCTHSSLKDLFAFVTDFMEANIKYAKVEFDESDYANYRSCAAALNRHIAKNKYSVIKATIINGEVYLIRTDL